ncbi:MAG: hypothetical protein ACK4X1_11780 [Terricaulis sp.]
MSGRTPPEHPKFEVAVEPAPRNEVVEAEEDEESKRARDAALASTYDPALAHSGKTDEEMIEERNDATRALLDAAIVVGIAVAVADNETLDVEEVVPPETDDDGGE